MIAGRDPGHKCHGSKSGLGATPLLVECRICRSAFDEVKIGNLPFLAQPTMYPKHLRGHWEFDTQLKKILIPTLLRQN